MGGLPLRPAVVILSVVLLVVVVAAGAGAPVQPLVAGWFLLVCPGLALAPLIRLGDLWDELALAVGVSVALDIVVATGLMYAGAWSPPLIVAVLGAVSLAGAALQLRAQEPGR
jgi:hypothetical protein